MNSTPLPEDHKIEVCKMCGGMIWLSQNGVECVDTFENWFQHSDPFDCIAEMRERLDRHSL